MPALNRLAQKPALEHRADMPVSDVEMLGISRVKIVNRPNETVPAVFNQQVSVVVHQAPCKQRDIVLFDSLP